MPKKKTDISALLLIIILSLLLAGVAVVTLLTRRSSLEGGATSEGVRSVLFVLESGSRPIGAYVLFYYPETKRAAVFDIPGEVGLIIRTANRVDRIDSVYDRNRLGPYEREVESLLGQDVQYTIVLDMSNLAKLVDLIGGIDIFIPRSVTRYGPDLALFPSGATRLDGEKAAAYLLIKEAATSSGAAEDLEALRERRQRFFAGLIKGLGEKAAFLKKPQANGVFISLLRTGMSARTQEELLEELSRLDTERLSIQAVGGILREVSGQQLLIPSYDGSLIKEIVNQTLAALTRKNLAAGGERVFTIEVLNGTATAGLAARTAELLRSFGYDVINVGNAGDSDYARTEIIDHVGMPEDAAVFASIIRCENIREELDARFDSSNFGLNLQELEERADFTLILGRDFNGRTIR